MSHLKCGHEWLNQIPQKLWLIALRLGVFPVMLTPMVVSLLGLGRRAQRHDSILSADKAQRKWIFAAPVRFLGGIRDLKTSADQSGRKGNA